MVSADGLVGQKGCKNQCPLDGQCLIDDIVGICVVSTSDILDKSTWVQLKGILRNDIANKRNDLHTSATSMLQEK